jgi:hypothetical protein
MPAFPEPSEITNSQYMIAAEAAELQDEAETFAAVQSLLPADLLDELTHDPSLLLESSYYSQPPTTFDLESFAAFASQLTTPKLVRQPSMTSLVDGFSTPVADVVKQSEQAPGAPKRPRCRAADSLDKWPTERLQAEYERRFRPCSQRHLMVSNDDLLRAIRQHAADSVASTIDEILEQPAVEPEAGRSGTAHTSAAAKIQSTPPTHAVSITYIDSKKKKKKCEQCGKSAGFLHSCKTSPKPKKARQSRFPQWLS